MQRLNHKFRQFQLLAITIVLAGCSRGVNLSDLETYSTEVLSRPGEQVEPVPEFVPYEGFIYSAASMRSPFEIPLVIDSESVAIMAEDVEPDFDRPRELLESQALSELTMVGMLSRSGSYEALIEDAFGEVHRIRVGNYLGRNHGRVENITQNQVYLVEIVPSGAGGWVERPQTLTLQ